MLGDSKKSKENVHKSMNLRPCEVANVQAKKSVLTSDQINKKRDIGMTDSYTAHKVATCEFKCKAS